MIRTREAGTLRPSDEGRNVTLAGWVARRRDHGGVVFIDLRDASGVVQVVFRQEDVAHDLRAEFCVLVTGTVRRRPAGNENPELRDRRGRGRGHRDRGAVRVRPAAVPDRRRGRAERGGAAALPLPRHPAAGDGGDAARQVGGGVPGRRRDAGPRVRERGDAVPDQVHAGGSARLPGAGAAAPRQLVRAAPVAPAVQAAADGRRAGTLLPAGALLPRRGLPGRPAAGVHPDRPGDVVRHPRGHRRGGREPDAAVVGGDRRVPGAAADPADDLRRRHGPVRVGQAGPAVRLRAGRPDRVLRANGFPGVPGAARGGGGHARRCRADPQGAGRLAGLGPRPRRQGAGVRADRRRRPGIRLRPGRPAPVRGRAVRPRRGGGGGPVGLRVLRGRDGRHRPRAARCGPAGDRAPLRPDRPVGVGVHLGGGRADVRG